MKLRVLIVDDEMLSRERMRRFLAAEPGTELVGECTNGKEAVRAIREHSPDVVLLDISMPELDGFGVLEELRGKPEPAVIFVTAHSEFAPRAFDIHAVDYLLKPFDRSRLRTAIGRAKERLEHPAYRSRNGMLPRQLETIPIKSSGRIKILRPLEIDWVGAADNYAELHVGSNTHLLRITLSELAERLPRNRFARVSKSALVNLDRVQEIRSRTHGDYVVVLHDGTCVPGTRTYRGTIAHLAGRVH